MNALLFFLALVSTAWLSSSESLEWTGENISGLADYCRLHQPPRVLLNGITFKEDGSVFNLGEFCSARIDFTTCNDLHHATEACSKEKAEIWIKVWTPPGLKMSDSEVIQTLRDDFKKHAPLGLVVVDKFEVHRMPGTPHETLAKYPYNSNIEYDARVVEVAGPWDTKTRKTALERAKDEETSGNEEYDARVVEVDNAWNPKPPPAAKARAGSSGTIVNTGPPMAQTGGTITGFGPSIDTIEPPKDEGFSWSRFWSYFGF